MVRWRWLIYPWAVVEDLGVKHAVLREVEWARFEPNFFVVFPAGPLDAAARRAEGERPRRDQVRFSVQIRGGVRHYATRRDGEALRGSISTDAAGRNVVASFELRRR